MPMLVFVVVWMQHLSESDMTKFPSNMSLPSKRTAFRMILILSALGTFYSIFRIPYFNRGNTMRSVSES